MNNTQTSGSPIQLPRPLLMTLADHAEAWWVETGHKVPNKDTEAYNVMYESWIQYAFSDLYHNNQDEED
jgi:hypothetical protein